MAVTNPLKRLRKKHRRQAVTGDATRLTGKRQQPTESQPVRHNGDDGIIRPQTGRLHLSSDLLESGGGDSDTRIDKVVIVVVALALLFIGIIAWFVARG
jgi:hypothetical protein